MWSWLGPSLIQGASGVLSNLIGGGNQPEGGGVKKAKHHQLDYDRRRIKALVDGARDAGIHPLVAMGSSGSGGFAAPVLGGQSSWGNAIGEAFSTAAELYSQDADRAERAREFEYRRGQDDDSRFQQILADQAQAKRDQLNERLVEAQIMESRSRTALDLARARAVGAMGSGSPTTLTDALGNQLTPPSGRASAQEMQDEYGDIVENVYGVGNWIQDMWSGKSPSWWPDSWSPGRGPSGSSVVGGPQP